MGRFARSHSGTPSVAARPRFVKDPQANARRSQIKPLSFNQSKPAIFSLDRRKRKGLRIIGLCMLLLAGLGFGWALGKSVLGPSRINQPQQAISTASVSENDSDKKLDEAAATPDLEAKTGDVQELTSESQDQNASADRSRRARNSGNARRALVTSKARTGPGIGVVTKPIKLVFRPLKKVNPLRLRLW